MPYQNDIPKATDIKSQSQVDILNNFIAIDNFVKVDHVALNEANQGKHNKTTFVTQASDPSTGATETALYCKRRADGIASLHFRPENNGTVQDLLLSNQALLNTNGWVKLPGGILWAWGIITGLNSTPTGGSGTLTFATIPGFPGFSAVYTCMVMENGTNASTEPTVGYDSLSTVSIIVKAYSAASRPYTTSAAVLVIGAY